MKMYVISDNVDTRTGMRLAGIEGCVAHGEAEVRAALDRALADEQIAVLLMTQKAQRDAGGLCVRGKVNTYAPADCEYSGPARAG